MQCRVIRTVDGGIHVPGHGSAFVQNGLVGQIDSEAFGDEGFVRSPAGDDSEKLAVPSTHESDARGHGMVVAIASRASTMVSPFQRITASMIGR